MNKTKAITYVDVQFDMTSYTYAFDLEYFSPHVTKICELHLHIYL